MLEFILLNRHVNEYYFEKITKKMLFNYSCKNHFFYSKLIYEFGLSRKSRLRFGYPDSVDFISFRDYCYYDILPSPIAVTFT